MVVDGKVWHHRIIMIQDAQKPSVFYPLGWFQADDFAGYRKADELLQTNWARLYPAHLANQACNSQQFNATLSSSSTIWMAMASSVQQHCTACRFADKDSKHTVLANKPTNVHRGTRLQQAVLQSPVMEVHTNKGCPHPLQFFQAGRAMLLVQTGLQLDSWLLDSQLPAARPLQAGASLMLILGTRQGVLLPACIAPQCAFPQQLLPGFRLIKTTYEMQQAIEQQA